MGIGYSRKVRLAIVVITKSITTSIVSTCKSVQVFNKAVYRLGNRRLYIFYRSPFSKLLATVWFIMFHCVLWFMTKGVVYLGLGFNFQLYWFFFCLQNKPSIKAISCICISYLDPLGEYPWIHDLYTSYSHILCLACTRSIRQHHWLLFPLINHHQSLKGISNQVLPLRRYFVFSVPSHYTLLRTQVIHAYVRMICESILIWW